MFTSRTPFSFEEKLIPATTTHRAFIDKVKGALALVALQRGSQGIYGLSVEFYLRCFNLNFKKAMTSGINNFSHDCR